MNISRKILTVGKVKSLITANVGITPFKHLIIEMTFIVIFDQDCFFDHLHLKWRSS